MISVIICSIDVRKYERVTANYAELFGNEPFEIIGIRDAKSLAEGYNRGFRQSSGSICIFSHDDIRIHSPDFVSKIRHHLKQFDLIGTAGNSKAIDGNWATGDWPNIHGQIAHPKGTGYEVMMCDCGRAALQHKTIVGEIQMLDGVIMAVNRRVLEKIAFDEKVFDGFHCYDVDFSYAAYLAGFRLGVFNDILIVHDSRGVYDAKWKKYAQAFAQKYRSHLAPPPAAGDPRNVWLIIPCESEEELHSAYHPDFQRTQALQFHSQPHLRFDGFKFDTGGQSLLKSVVRSLFRRG